METNNAQKSIPFLKLLAKNVILIVLITILCGLLALGYSLLKEKSYYTVSQSVILRTSVSSASGSSSQSTNASHGKIYIPMVKASITNPNSVQKIRNLYEEMYPDAEDTINSGLIGINYKENSLIFNISYTDISEERAKEKLDVIYIVAREQLKVDIKADSVDLILTDGTDEVFSVVSQNNTVTNVIIGVLVGFVISAVVVLLIYMFDNTVKDKKEFEELTGVSVLSYLGKQ